MGQTEANHDLKWSHSNDVIFEPQQYIIVLARGPWHVTWTFSKGPSTQAIFDGEFLLLAYAIA